ncbi:SDR family NAD(P)-dependent oxidoreductase [Amaricoccus sp.]|uniref:SDR family NAD(P)-dependent oxidoreductase n=1 Tax=Amaricoccus sp. TaxID=1872485 RepID=UPI001B5F9489|nr:SDR family NAD(P)-dependent oxidoreductase [Amaricoccus sp.]MBP7002641.1 SDR family oxidoreductase [Amaricoccus sp.]
MSGAVVVTGGASGIGRAVIDAVLAEGWRAVVLDLPGAALDAARAALDPATARVAGIDVSDEAAVAAEIAEIERDFAPIAGVVNSAGIARDLPAMETDAALFRRILDINVVGSFVVAREAARAMRGRGGSIVNIASVSGLRGNEGRVAYGASKGAVVTMSLVLAVEFAEIGVRVNVVAPGPIETPMVREHHDDVARATWMGAVPMRRYGTPEEIAAAVVFLLDGSRSGYVTGQTLSVDGGFTAAGILTGKSRAATVGAA